MPRTVVKADKTKPRAIKAKKSENLVLDVISDSDDAVMETRAPDSDKRKPIESEAKDAVKRQGNAAHFSVLGVISVVFAKVKGALVSTLADEQHSGTQVRELAINWLTADGSEKYEVYFFHDIQRDQSECEHCTKWAKEQGIPHFQPAAEIIDGNGETHKCQPSTTFNSTLRNAIRAQCRD